MDRKNQADVQEFEVLRRMAATVDIPIDLRRVQTYSAYLRGAQAAISAFAAGFPQIFKGKDAAYNKAFYRLVTSTLRNTDLFLSGEYEIRFRNFKSDRKGKCVECEAYFSRQVIVNEEVK